jgi:hypothetical protein
MPEPRAVTFQEWRTLNEVRDLAVESAEEAKRQVDLRKETGSFFNYVIDEGSFYTPNRGYAEREFYRDPSSGDVQLRIGYDVYPQASFSGMYFKTRGLDLSDHTHLTFELKVEESMVTPYVIRLEMKDGRDVKRGFSVTSIEKNWRLYEFIFSAQKSTPVTELVFVVENARAGALAANGAIHIRNLNLQ